MNIRRLNDDLTRLRRFRNRSDADLTLAAPLREVERELQRRARAANGLGDAWAAVLPSQLARGSEIVSFSRGVLTVRTTDSAIRFKIDRFLRGGGQAALAQRSGIVIRRIRLL